MTVAQTVRLAGKSFVIVEEKHYQKLVEQAENMRRMTGQDLGDVAESKRLLRKPGQSISWDLIKTKRRGARNASNRRRKGT